MARSTPFTDELLPPSTLAGFVPTLNATGWMTAHPEPISESFIDFVAQRDDECLDIGCAYGVATLPALARGAHILACDMEPRHLEILWQRTPEPHRSRLRIKPATLPDVRFPAESFGAILCARALHFLRGPDITSSVRSMASWLKTGGHLYLVSDSPYVGPWASRAPQYERRKAAGEDWPGFLSPFIDLLPPGSDLAKHPPFINPLDPDILRREVVAAGLSVVECHWLPSLSPGGPARERAGVIARKSA